MKNGNILETFAEIPELNLNFFRQQFQDCKPEKITTAKAMAENCQFKKKVN